jgi:hypothetical protein
LQALVLYDKDSDSSYLVQDLKAMFKWCKKFESLLPAIPLIICAAIFYGADYYPGETPEEIGLTWHECRVSEETYLNVTNEMQVERCFGHPADWSGTDEDFINTQEIQKPIFISADQPYLLNGKQIFLARMGVKYFVMYEGQKVGPTFSDVQLGNGYGVTEFSVDHGKGWYVFRGVRNGNYYLVEISSQNAQNAMVSVP